MSKPQAANYPNRKKTSALKHAKRRIVFYFAPLVLRLLVSTWRLKVEDRSGLQPEESRVMVAWHEQLPALIPYGLCWTKEFHILISPSRDGDAGTDLADTLGIRTVRGSSSHGGLGALRHLVRILRQGPNWIGILADGPRGPARQPKPGPALLAALAKVPIVPVAAVASPYWRLKSWDKTIIPLPFASIRVLVGPALAPCESTDRKMLETLGNQMAQALNQQENELRG